MLWIGPGVVVLLIACLCLLLVLAALWNRGEPLARLAARASARLDQNRLLPTLWGLAASVLLFVLTAVLFSAKLLALLGFVPLLAGLALAALGLGAAALGLGQRLLEIGGAGEIDTLPALRLGLWSLLLSAAVPFAGWLLVLLVLASGIGVVLETLLARDRA